MRRKPWHGTVAALLLFSAAEVFAGGGLWTAEGTPPYLWNDPLNWEHGLPTAEDTCYITSNWAYPDKGPLIEEGIDAVCGILILGWDPFTPVPGETATLTITGGSFYLREAWLGKDDGNDGNEGPGILDISGGIFAVSEHLIVGQGSTGLIHQTGGEVSAWRLVLDWDSNSPGLYHLYGGTLTVTDEPAPLHLRPGAHIDIEEGVMILAGDHVAMIEGAVNGGVITGYGGTEPVLYDYDVTNPGQTTVYVVPPAGSPFLVTSIDRSAPDAVRITWEPQSPAVYRVEAADGPGGLWGEIAGPLGVEEYEDAVAGLGRRFYRVLWEKDATLVLFEDDFESGPGDWTTSGLESDNWELGVPVPYVDGGVTNGPPAAAGGTNVWASGLGEAYGFGDAAGSDVATLSSPVIDLTGVTAATLSFDSWVETEQNFDLVRLDVYDADSSTVLGSVYQKTGRFPEWSAESLSLTAYTGKRIQLRFVVNADDVLSYYGWAIDNVTVTSP